MGRSRHRAAVRRVPGTRMVAAGAALFAVGAGFVAGVFVPFLFGRRERGVALSLATFLTVVGLGLGLVGLYRQGRAGRVTDD